MTSYEFGDVVLLWFPQSGKPQPKRRPALVIADTKDQDAIFAPITSVERTGIGDIPLADWSDAGLARKSWVRLGKIAALQKEMVERPLGCLVDSVRSRIVEALNDLFRL